MNKLLTNKPAAVYAESLKTATIGFRTRQICDFFVFANWRMRAENILNISQGFIVAAFSESATFHNCVAFLKKATKMTNTIISKISEIRSILDDVYANTSSQPLALHCSAVRKELADLIIEILDQKYSVAE